MKRFTFPAILIQLLLFISCSDKHQSENYDIIENKFLETKDLSQFRQTVLYGIFDQELTTEEQTALKFLYAYMPLSDLADYDGDFFLKNVRTTLKAKKDMSWGKTIPESIFMHFVLPVRINNENLDSSRWVFFNELQPRIQGLSMKEAALEVNHWCHEKANYQPSDSRTSSPLATVKTGYGRCGEESTFTVAALRSVSIPARQCYTPLWAHCDDNHAWVEVWVDGKWSYLGACEPEPDLNLAWFTEPAKRAMLVNSTVYGKYSGEEETINEEEYYTRINQIGFYAPTRKLNITITDQKGVNIDSAEVYFMLYNYAGFYPIASKFTGKNGTTSLITGKGDMLVWAAKDSLFAYALVSKDDTTVHIAINKRGNDNSSFSWQIIPPVIGNPTISDTLNARKNQVRIAQEDSIRNAYIARFPDSAVISEFAISTRLDVEKTYDYIKKSRGNYNEIFEYLQKADKHPFTFDLLDAISEKDLRDATADCLLDHLRNTPQGIPENIPEDIFIKYVLNPRIEREMLVPYRQTLKEFDIRKGTSEFTIEELLRWTAEKIDIQNKRNYYGVRLSPLGVYNLMAADEKSRDIFFVALCRSRNIPARLQEESAKVQYFMNNQWYDVKFSAEEEPIPEKTGTITLKMTENDTGIDPKYSIHFSIAKLQGSYYHPLDYEWEKPFSRFEDSLKLEAGSYMLVTGNRDKEGSVASYVNFFTVQEGIHKTVTMKMLDNSTEKSIIYSFNREEIFTDESGKKITMDELSNDTPVVFFLLSNENEPTKHLLNYLSGSGSDFADKSVCFVGKLPGKEYNLPFKYSVLTADIKSLLEQIPDVKSENFPYSLVVKNNNLYYFDQGYNISMGSQTLKTLQEL